MLPSCGGRCVMLVGWGGKCPCSRRVLRIVTVLGLVGEANQAISLATCKTLGILAAGWFFSKLLAGCPGTSMELDRLAEASPMPRRRVAFADLSNSAELAASRKKPVARTAAPSPSIPLSPSSAASKEYPPWTRCFDPRYKYHYWYNHTTGVSTWTEPDEAWVDEHQPAAAEDGDFWASWFDGDADEAIRHTREAIQKLKETRGANRAQVIEEAFEAAKKQAASEPAVNWTRLRTPLLFGAGLYLGLVLFGGHREEKRGSEFLAELRTSFDGQGSQAKGEGGDVASISSDNRSDGVGKASSEYEKWRASRSSNDE